MRPLDLNADLGEGERTARTHALMRWIDSANVACGGHAGGADTMSRAVRAARRFRVNLGAHPGLWSRGDGFGREVVALTAGELSLLLLHQVGALDLIARSEGLRLHHIKLHGALYHMTEADPRLARAYLDAVRRWWPRLKVYALAGGRVALLGRALGLAVWEEAFLDRAYRADGSLVPRTQKGAVLTQASTVLRRLELLRDKGMIEAVDGTRRSIQPHTLCIHSDTEGAARLARRAAEALRGPRKGS